MLPRIYRSDGDIRKHQINTLKVFNDNVVEIVENQEYQIAFKSGGNELCLRIQLGVDFPQEHPSLTVSPPVRHPWIVKVGSGEITAAPGLLNFTVHSDLGRVVQVIIREFERNPPALYDQLGLPNVVFTDLPTPTTATTTASLQQYSSGSVSLFPELRQLPQEDLEDLLNNDEKQLRLVWETSQNQEQLRVLGEWMSHVERVAERNVGMRNQVDQLKCSVNGKIHEMTQMAVDNEQLFAVYQELAHKYSPENIRKELKLATVSAERQSEGIADRFLAGDLDVDQFLNVYVKSRTLYQQRKAKEEQLAQQLEHLKKAGF